VTIIINSESFFCDWVILKVPEVFWKNDNNKYMAYYYSEPIYCEKII
jgi:hypothetical protein